MIFWGLHYRCVLKCSKRYTIVAKTEEVFYPPINEFLKAVIAQRLPYDIYFLGLNVDLGLLQAFIDFHRSLSINYITSLTSLVCENYNKTVTKWHILHLNVLVNKMVN